MTKRSICLTLLASIRLMAGGRDPAEPRTEARTEKTRRIEFTGGGLIRIRHSTGELTIEAWDKPTVELTTVKSSRTAVSPEARERADAGLEKAVITSQRKGDELQIDTDAPRRSGFAIAPFAREARTDISYHLWVPRDSRLAIDHIAGNVTVDGVAGDIGARIRQGELLLRLPENGRYTTKAKCAVGAISSEFTVEEMRMRSHFGLGHRVMQKEAAPVHALDLKVGYGDIVILKTRVPQIPALAAPRRGGAGL